VPAPKGEVVLLAGPPGDAPTASEETLDSALAAALAARSV
jgi:hypothetical protein